uniref:Uncharacterized protein n=1 Tax=Anguilla anguilla TaxID=7936 RepID=A0A0E9PMN4_ANGAN
MSSFRSLLNIYHC